VYKKRTLDPFHAICQRGHWYIIARRDDDPELHIYSFSRIRNARLTGRNYTIPEDFRPHDYFDREMGVFVTDRIPYTFEFIIDKEIQTYALERQFHETQKVKQLEDGSVMVQFTTTQIEEVKRWVMGQGATVRVVSPPELITRIKDEISKMKKMYR
jgi:predicted DNA-binding transcriptional regulator YafY